MKTLQNTAAFVFIVCVAVLSGISILGIWDFFSDDVITKSFQTIGLLGGVAVIVIVAGRFIDSRDGAEQTVVGVGQVPAVTTNPAFTTIRHMTLAVLITSVAVLALIGVLAIWEVMSGDVLHKSASSIGVLVFASLIIVVTCLEREQHRLIRQKISGGVVLLVLLMAWIFWGLVF